MSHHTGAQFVVLPFHTIELINVIRQLVAAHIMKRQVPVFQARRCQRKGRQRSTKAIKENIEKT